MLIYEVYTGGPGLSPPVGCVGRWGEIIETHRELKSTELCTADGSQSINQCLLRQKTAQWNVGLTSKNSESSLKGDRNNAKL